MWPGKASLNIWSHGQHHAKKDEIAVHCGDPALSVLVMLVSRNAFHVVSALQSIARPRRSSALQRAHKPELDSLRPCEPCNHKSNKHIISKVIHLELFLDVVSISFTDVTIGIA